MRAEKRANKSVKKIIVLFSETETAKQNQKFPFHFLSAPPTPPAENQKLRKENFWFLLPRPKGADEVRDIRAYASFSLHNARGACDIICFGNRCEFGTIQTGEFVAVMGPSGSGKSTLLHILGFLDRPTGGTYLFDGKALADYSEDEIAEARNEKMGFVFQAFNLLSRTTVLDNVKLPLFYSRQDEKLWEKTAKKAIEAVGLGHRLGYFSSQLSGGEKQRVAIARALVNNPQIIFADEPTGNLDSKSGETVMNILRRLNANDKKTIILITHETYTSEYAQRIIYFKDGKIDSDAINKNRRRPEESFKK
ncbi:MAG: ABC transporter ATP-binding protein [Minisyncoccia bacterium]